MRCTNTGTARAPSATRTRGATKPIPECRLKTAGWRLTDWRLAIGDWRLAIADWRLAIGHWALAIGHWALAIGHWALAIGHWALAIGHWRLSGQWSIHSSIPQSPIRQSSLCSLQSPLRYRTLVSCSRIDKYVNSAWSSGVAVLSSA